MSLDKKIRPCWNVSEPYTDLQYITLSEIYRIAGIATVQFCVIYWKTCLISLMETRHIAVDSIVTWSWDNHSRLERFWKHSNISRVLDKNNVICLIGEYKLLITFLCWPHNIKHCVTFFIHQFNFVYVFGGFCPWIKLLFMYVWYTSHLLQLLYKIKYTLPLIVLTMFYNSGAR